MVARLNSASRVYLHELLEENLDEIQLPKCNKTFKKRLRCYACTCKKDIYCIKFCLYNFQEDILFFVVIHNCTAIFSRSSFGQSQKGLCDNVEL